MSDTKQEGIIADSRPADEVSDEKVLIAEAAAGFANERELGPLAALKAYPWAIVWSLVMALCVIMEGYDIGSFFAYRMLPKFIIRLAAYRHVRL
jgi:SP family general alpha glucoside:H+ symporter-like MFS transporter